MPKEPYYQGITAFTGHRDYGDPAAVYYRLDQLNSRSYMFGGARGIDSDALTYLAQTQPNSIRIVVVANDVDSQPAEAKFAISNYSTEVIELGNTGKDRYFIRNKYLVNNSNRLEAFYDGRTTGGTFQTINYARSRGETVNVNLLTETNFQDMYDLEEIDFMKRMESLHQRKVNPFQLKHLTIDYYKLKGIELPPSTIQRFHVWEFE